MLDGPKIDEHKELFIPTRYSNAYVVDVPQVKAQGGSSYNDC